MLQIRKAEERGRAVFGWLDSRHTFSFGHYYDPEHLGFGSLRVINDDRVAPGAGFPAHPHRDMEIITYVLDGSIAHRDSTGVGSTILRGDVQRMSAGTGITHSEFNASEEVPLRLLQIWIVPARRGLPPGYEQKHFTEEDKRGRLCLVASRDGREGSVTLHQDASIHAALLGGGDRVEHRLEPGRRAWLQVARGSVRVGGHELAEGDGLAAVDEGALIVEGLGDAEVLLFDLGA